jgi:HEAT repeat protein
VILALLLAGCAARGPTVAPTAPVPAASAVTLEPRVRLVLEAAAADLDVEVRMRALATLVRTSDEAGGGRWWARGRFDPSDYVRRAAVDALATRPDREVTAGHLVDAASDAASGCWTRGAAANALVDLTPDRASALPDDACPAILLARARGGDVASTERLGAWLRAADLPLELGFLRSLGRSGVPALAAPLRDALASAEPEVRLAGAVALLGLDAPAARAVLEPALRGADEDPALEAVELLVASGDPAAPELLRVARSSGPPSASVVSALALVGLGESDLSDALRRSEDPDREIRAAAFRAVAQRLAREPEARGAERARDAAREALPTDDPAVQDAAIAALAGSTRPADRAALTALLDDPSMLTRVRAADALAR